MKILIIAPHFYPKNTGYGNAITRFAFLLSEMGEKIDVLTPQGLDNSKEIKKEGLRVYRIKSKRKLKWISYIIRQIKTFREIIQLDKKNNYEIIFFETLSYSITLYLLSFTSKFKKTIVRIHGCASTEGIIFNKLMRFRFLLFLLKKVFRKLNFISSTTPYYIEFAKKFFLDNNPLLCGEKTFVVIPNFTYSDIEKPRDLLQIESILNQKTTFLTLGATDNNIHKGISDVVYAIFLLKNKNYFPKLRLIIIGQEKDGNPLSKIIQNLGLSKNIIFIQNLSNSQVQYLQSKVGAVIMASRFEGLSMFGLESLCNGAPLIVSKIGGLKDIVEEGRNGLFFESQDIFQLSQKIDFFIRKVDMEAFKKNSKKLYKQKFSPEKVYKTFLGMAKIMIALHD